MVTIEKDKIIIEIRDTSPEDFLKSLQTEIIVCLQTRPEDERFGYYMLELLKQTMDLKV